MLIIGDYKRCFDVTDSYLELLSKTETPVGKMIHISEEAREAERNFLEYYDKILNPSLGIPYPRRWLTTEEFLIEPHNVIERLSKVKKAVETKIKDLETGKEKTEASIELTEKEAHDLRVYQEYLDAVAKARIKETAEGITVEMESTSQPRQKSKLKTKYALLLEEGTWEFKGQVGEEVNPLNISRNTQEYLVLDALHSAKEGWVSEEELLIAGQIQKHKRGEMVSRGKRGQLQKVLTNIRNAFGFAGLERNFLSEKDETRGYKLLVPCRK